MDGSVGRKGSVGRAALWMLGLTVLLFWPPAIGPLIAGAVGGAKAGGVGPAVVAAVVPAILASVLFFLAGSLFDLPVIGAIVEAGVLVVVLLESVPLLAGAALGAVFAR